MELLSELSEAQRPRVVVIGAGVGGLRVAQRLRNITVDVRVIDRHNLHTFMPLLYEVATAGLAADDIAQPVRAILRGPPRPPKSSSSCEARTTGLAVSNGC